MKTCDDCKFCINVDFGYSNWTVEGTNSLCGKNLRPAVDHGYGLAPELKVAETCPEYEEGEPIVIDVEGEAIESLEPWQKVLYDNCND